MKIKTIVLTKNEGRKRWCMIALPDLFHMTRRRQKSWIFHATAQRKPWHLSDNFCKWRSQRIKNGWKRDDTRTAKETRPN
jgi:hypothetical protein